MRYNVMVTCNLFVDAQRGGDCIGQHDKTRIC